MKQISLIVFGLWLPVTGLNAAAPRMLDRQLLSQLRAEASRAHPTVLAARERAAAAGIEVRAIRLWSDPMVGIGFSGGSRMMRAADGDVIVGFEQALPKPGMAAAERAQMAAIQRAGNETAAGAGLSVGADAARAAIELALADESIAVQAAKLAWLAAMTENARQMAIDPMGAATDALRMETELARETGMLEAARHTRAGYARKLNLALGRPLDAAWPELRLPPTPPPVPVAAAEVARIPHVNPRVRAMREMTAAAAASARMVDRERLPEVTVGADTRLYSGNGDIRETTVGIKLSLPWFNDPAYRARIDAARQRESAAGQEVEAMRREIATLVVAAAAEAAAAAAQARALGGEARDTAAAALRTTEAAWLSSKAPLTDLLDTARVLDGIRLEARRMVAMQLAAMEELHTLVPSR